MKINHNPLNLLKMNDELLYIESTDLSDEGSYIEIKYWAKYWPSDCQYAVLEITQDIFEGWLRDTGRLDECIDYCKMMRKEVNEAFGFYKEEAKMNSTVFDKDIFEYMSNVIIGTRYIKNIQKALEEKRKIIHMILKSNPGIKMPEGVSAIPTYK